jgi:hypothetical protein
MSKSRKINKDISKYKNSIGMGFNPFFYVIILRFSQKYNKSIIFDQNNTNVFY